MNKVLMIGPSQVGKSCVITASSMSLKSMTLPSNKVLSFSLTDYSTQLTVNDRIQKLVDKQWPDSTANLSKYNYNVRIGSDVIAQDLCFIDSAGGWWEQQGKVAAEGRSDLLCEVNDPDCVCLLFVIPADMVKDAINNPISIMKLMVYQDILENIRNSSSRNLPEIGIILSKLDAVKEKDMDVLLAFIKHQLPAFFCAGSHINVDIMKSQLGYDLKKEGENHLIGTLDLRPKNHCAPFLFALRCALARQLNMSVNDHKKQEEKLAKNTKELSSKRSAGWFSSWWDYEPEDYYNENIKDARKGIEVAVNGKEKNSSYYELISGLLTPLLLQRIENGRVVQL